MFSRYLHQIEKQIERKETTMLVAGDHKGTYLLAASTIGPPSKRRKQFALLNKNVTHLIEMSHMLEISDYEYYTYF